MKWTFNRLGRWKSKTWLGWVHELHCVKGGPDPIVAAHFRTAATGTGSRPDDCFVYPVSDTIHRGFHQHGHPSKDEQWRWVWETWQRFVRQGRLCGSDGALAWLLSVGDHDGTVHHLEAVLKGWRERFANGELQLSSPSILLF